MGVKLIKDETLTGIANAIRVKEGSEDLIPVTEMANRIENIDGGNAGIPGDAITTITLRSLNPFGKSKVEINLPRTNTLLGFLNLGAADTSIERVNTTVEELTITCVGSIVSTSNNISNYRNIPDKKLRKLTLNCDFSGAAGFSSFILNQQALEEVLGNPIDMSSATSVSNFCGGALALREIRFQGLIPQTLTFKDSPLSKESILSIMSCLSDSASGKSVTFNKEAVNKAFETSEGAADGSASDEWSALVATEPNWTISLA